MALFGATFFCYISVITSFIETMAIRNIHCRLFFQTGFFSLLIFFTSCHSSRNPKKLFEKLPASFTHVDFQNNLTETDTFNYFLFSYMYMGGGVSVADFNNDGLTDIYFTGNMTSNRLYLNMGNLQFKDVTEISRTGGDSRWMLGTTVCDINNDGLKDIYISVSGLHNMCRNILFVNQGNNKDGIPVFTEEAEKYGIDDNGKSTHSTFFDYDNDGDLDLYVANYPITRFQSPPYSYRQMMRNAQHRESSHLYRNEDNGRFTDVTEQAGLLNFGLSLSATVSDLNQDGYKDLYVSNDFTSPDFYYMNNGDGTFTDRCLEVTGQTSFYGMGADIADYNNDGLPDIIQIDMAPEDNLRSKENMTSMPLEDFAEMIQQGLNYQYRYSTLQLNRGVHENGLPYFSNAAWIAGVTSTDWSWGALFADFNLDGWKDLYITNGSRRDINNIDFFNQLGETMDQATAKGKDKFLYLIEKMPYTPLTNYLYRNNRDLTFSKANQEWGITETSYSNGMAYADLDNDGDLDLVVNNIDAEAFIYKNNARELSLGNYLKIAFAGSSNNKMGIGTTVTIWKSGMMQMAELTLERGYESSVEPFIYFGWTGSETLDSLLVKWPDQKTQFIKNMKGNRRIELQYDQASENKPRNTANQAILFTPAENILKTAFTHQENQFNDYLLQSLLPHKLSYDGPYITTGDVNNDGMTDFFAGNGSGKPGRMYLQHADGTFAILNGPWESDSTMQDMGCLLFDANGDQKTDLYVVSGGNEFPDQSPQYADRLYMNAGDGTFLKSQNALPDLKISGSCVKAIDYDRDGDLDLVVGGRNVPGRYPFPAYSAVLENKSTHSKVLFEDVTQKIAPELANAGMVNDIFCADINNDQWTDMIVAGEWMPVTCLINNKGVFQKQIIPNSSGWWFDVEGADFDGDGDMDFIAGNLGLNTRYQVNENKTFDVFAGDFDLNGSSEIALSYYQDGKLYPLRSRQCYILQNPGIALKFPTYKSFGESTVYEVFGKKLLKRSLHLQAETFASCYFENLGNGAFKMTPLAHEAQLSPVNAILINDFNNDGQMDILTAGNIMQVEVVTPKFDGGVGLLLNGNGKGGFEPVAPSLTGFFAPDEVHSLALITLAQGKRQIVLVGNNHQKLKLFYAK